MRTGSEIRKAFVKAGYPRVKIKVKKDYWNFRNHGFENAVFITYDGDTYDLRELEHFGNENCKDFQNVFYDYNCAAAFDR